MTEPVRTCLGCRRRYSRRALVRLVAEGGAVRVDARRDRPGRGAWVCPNAACAEQATGGKGGRRVWRALRADSATVTLDVEALRAAIVAAGSPDLGRDADPRHGPHRDPVAVQPRFRTPSEPDVSRGVPT